MHTGIYYCPNKRLGEGMGRVSSTLDLWRDCESER